MPKKKCHFICAIQNLAVPLYQKAKGNRSKQRKSYKLKKLQIKNRDMVHVEDIKGLVIVGYRYGEAPACGRSYDSWSEEYECGVSMASVGYLPEVKSFAVGGHKAAKSKRYYYIGEFAGFGGDSEVCLLNVKKITRNEYLKLRKEQKDAHNKIVNCHIDRKLRIIANGYDIHRTPEQLEAERANLLVK